MGLLLRAIGKEVDYVIDGRVTENLKIEKEAARFRCETNDIYDAVIVLDCGDDEILYGREYLSAGPVRIVIDHHATNRQYGDINLVDDAIAATGELVVDLYDAFQVPISCEAAAWLYLSLATDTGNFRYSNVTAQTHFKMARIYEIRDDLAVINRQIEAYDVSKLIYLGKIIEHMQSYFDGRLLMSYLTRADYIDGVLDENHEAQLQNIIDFMRGVEGVEVAVLLKMTAGGTLKASLRSNTDFDVAVIAAEFGGGGHSKAAGFDVDLNVEELMAMLEKSIGEQL